MLFKHIPGRSFTFAVLCLFLHLSSALAQESPSTQANASPTGNSKISTAEKQKIAAAAINLPIFFVSGSSSFTNCDGAAGALFSRRRAISSLEDASKGRLPVKIS